MIKALNPKSLAVKYLTKYLTLYVIRKKVP